MGVWNGWGYGIAFIRALNFLISEPANFAKIALSAEIPRFSWKYRPLKSIFRSLENSHSTRHQSIPPLGAGRVILRIETLVVGCSRAPWWRI